MLAYQRASFSEAFAAYTDAIRLCPSSATYHANRAAAAVKLGRYAVALQDARCEAKQHWCALCRHEQP